MPSAQTLTEAPPGRVPQSSLSFEWERLANVPYSQREELVRWALLEGERLHNRWRERQVSLANESGEHPPTTAYASVWQEWQVEVTKLSQARTEVWEEQKQDLSEAWYRFKRALALRPE